MEVITQSLIEKMQSAISQSELYDAVAMEHSRVKEYLLRNHKDFYLDDSPYSQDLIGGQRSSGEVAIMAKTYEELNYIRLVVSGNDIQMHEPERFHPIKQLVLDALVRIEH